MTTFPIKVEVRCGEKTCASEPGVFCGQFGSKHFGQRPWCMHFDEELFEVDGWTQRCGKCLLAEKEST